MMKYPIGIQSFNQIIEDGYVYVDKTDLIYQLVTTGKIYFLSRPRRFGKSLLVSTLKCYFQGRKELFRGLAIDKLETEWAEYPVFHIDFNGDNFTKANVLEQKIENHIADWEKTYGKSDTAQTTGDRFVYVLRQAHKRYGRRCVVLIDEYDKPILDVLDTGYKTTIDGEERPLEDWHREVLKGFYSTFKSADEDLSRKSACSAALTNPLTSAWTIGMKRFVALPKKNWNGVLPNRFMRWLKNTDVWMRK